MMGDFAKPTYYDTAHFVMDITGTNKCRLIAF